MRELPTGTVTFLFSDIEGSTKLLQAAADEYAGLLARHAAVLRAAVESCEGTEVSTEGDSFFLVFRSPAAAVRAAVQAQRALAAEEWPEGRTIRVRMGLHTGEGIRGGDNYAGLDVNRAARVTSAAHGGQVLMTAATRGLVEHHLPEGTALRDLGPHRLKDLTHPEQLHQLVIEGLPAEFPPPRTLDARPNNLPAPATRFIGRTEVVAEIIAALADARLLTLTGPGGTGKTRLGIAVAMEALLDFADGAFFVDLSPITDPLLVASTIREALGVGEDPQRPSAEILAEHLRDRELLLVLDNFEQVTDAADMIGTLMQAAPGLKVLATSRIPLHLYGEREFPVPPLVLPDPEVLPDAAQASQYEAVMLFIDRATAVKPDFQVTNDNAPAVAEICYRLDGLPLAIELAASRVKILSPDAMLPRLQNRLQLASQGARDLPERQRTLRGAIEWSYDLLDESERALFARLGAFMGGATPDATEAVANPDGELGPDTFDALASLVDKSLVRQVEAGGEARFVMLETIREYAIERLDELGESEEIRRRHAVWVRDLAEEARPHFVGTDQAAWLDRLDLEHDNVRAALRWAIDANEAGLALATVAALWRFFQQRGHLREGRAWTEAALAMPAPPEAVRERGGALTAAGGLAYWQNDYPASNAFYREAVEAWRASGDGFGLANALYDLSFTHTLKGEREDANRMLEEARGVAVEAGDRLTEANAQLMIGLNRSLAGDYQVAIDEMAAALQIYREQGNGFAIADTLTAMGQAEHLLGRYDAARAAYRESAGRFREVDNATGLEQNVYLLACLEFAEGNPERALTLLGADAAVRESLGGGAPKEILSVVVEGDPTERIRAALDPEVADAAWERGRLMTLDQAIAFGLRDEPAG